MNFDDQINLEHLLFSERKCRVCGQVKDIIDGFYLTRKSRATLLSSYSYECKECTKKRVLSNKKHKISTFPNWNYPDW